METRTFAQYIVTMLESLNVGDLFAPSLQSVLRVLLGIVSLLLIAVLFSRNRKAIGWKQVGIGLLVQLLLAIGSLAPSTRLWLTKYGPYAVLTGTLVSCKSATIVGLFIG